MAKGYTVTATINRPVWEVWAFITDFRNAPKWMTGVEELVIPRGSEIKAGLRCRFKAGGASREAEITLCEPGKTIALTVSQGRTAVTYTYTLREKGNSTAIALEAVYKVRGLWRMAYPFLISRMRKSDGDPVAQLKRAMEAPDTGAPKAKASA